MTEPQVKPGTRCECRRGTCPAPHARREHRLQLGGIKAGPIRCNNDAERYVVAPKTCMVAGIIVLDGIVYAPLCEPCAAFAERGK